ncbi:hypothetical protein Cgig2_003630 [Carnegiea gigantea]|uniref:RNase H type-1 domain-containing protein n=1 Tax=Carnegiea gigantea TaxID=171969 RepID=A0A9Q1QE62_9CARY|nr:hypothetical protein Cgig2_003630 [Carnegiea gigantea]
MASPFFDFNQLKRFCSVVEAFDAFKLAHLQHVEAFVAVMWTIWNSRNEHIYSKIIVPPEMTHRKALKFEHKYKEAVEHFLISWDNPSSSVWTPPTMGLVKFNFDGTNLRDWGDNNGDTLFMAAKQSPHFSGLEAKEANACLFALHIAWKYGYRKVLLEGDNSKAQTQTPLWVAF